MYILWVFYDFYMSNLSRIKGYSSQRIIVGYLPCSITSKEYGSYLGLCVHMCVCMLVCVCVCVCVVSVMSVCVLSCEVGSRSE